VCLQSLHTLIHKAGQNAQNLLPIRTLRTAHKLGPCLKAALAQKDGIGRVVKECCRSSLEGSSVTFRYVSLGFAAGRTL
jgi:hypothetical protein